MILDVFITKYNGRYVDFDKAYGPQCVDLMRQYIEEVLRKPQIPKANYAKNKLKRDKIRVTLAALVGLTYPTMSKAQQESFVTALAQLLDVMDADGKVKAPDF